MEREGKETRADTLLSCFEASVFTILIELYVHGGVLDRNLFFIHRLGWKPGGKVLAADAERSVGSKHD